MTLKSRVSCWLLTKPSSGLALAHSSLLMLMEYSAHCVRRMALILRRRLVCNEVSVFRPYNFGKTGHRLTYLLTLPLLFLQTPLRTPTAPSSVIKTNKENASSTPKLPNSAKKAPTLNQVKKTPKTQSSSTPKIHEASLVRVMQQEHASGSSRTPTPIKVLKEALDYIQSCAQLGLYYYSFLFISGNSKV